VLSKIVSSLAVIVLITGCATSTKTGEGRKGDESIEKQRTIELAPTQKEVLLRKAKNYQQNGDYANALINIVRAEKAEGDEALNDEISQFKNNLIENLNSRAIDAVMAVEIGKGLDVPLEYMVFYMEGEVIYPVFNFPVAFEVRKGEAQITGRSFTDSNGVAACEVIKVEALDENEVLVRAGVSLEIEGEIFTIQKLQIDFTLHYQSVKEQTISFVTYESNIDRVVQSSTSGKQIEQVFIKNGFSVVHGMNETNRELFVGATSGDASALHVYKEKLDSRLIAFTYIESVFSSKVSESFYFARAKIILDIVDASTNKVVFNSVIEDVKGAGSTEEKAWTKAINEATGEFIERLKNEISSLEIE